MTVIDATHPAFDQASPDAQRPPRAPANGGQASGLGGDEKLAAGAVGKSAVRRARWVAVAVGGFLLPW